MSRTGTQFTCFTSTKVQILTCVAQTLLQDSFLTLWNTTRLPRHTHTHTPEPLRLFPRTFAAGLAACLLGHPAWKMCCLDLNSLLSRTNHSLQRPRDVDTNFRRPPSTPADTLSGLEGASGSKRTRPTIFEKASANASSDARREGGSRSAGGGGFTLCGGGGATAGAAKGRGETHNPQSGVRLAGAPRLHSRLPWSWCCC